MNELPEWLSDSRQTAPLAAMLAPGSSYALESLAAEARVVTMRRFGRTMTLYAPLYLSNHCSSGCVYCGFASDRTTLRRRLEPDEIERELFALKKLGVTDLLLLTGERTGAAGFDYLRTSVEIASKHMQRVSVEAFPMSTAEYRELAESGCTGITIYQETYDLRRYKELHRWGPKKDYIHRLETPERALEGGMKTVGLGVLLGLSDPLDDALMLFRHVRHLHRTYWRAGISVSFPRMRPQTGGYAPPFCVSDHVLARMIFAFRIALPDTDLVLSTRESPAFRDGMAGLGITRMSIASRTTVGGYDEENAAGEKGQFDISDDRSAAEFCSALRAKNIEPVFKNWEPAYNGPSSGYSGNKPRQEQPCR
ncbi:MAG: 2-iminoacetate synthase ThiH [Chlorobiaceae bacterium]|nr:2-iminoacetate synthase ThiH [Chlorobiaceae bacterium]NTV60511.1 2-iminoacetate synthase ThiH [Chlorobiaceae bacterium]